MSKILGDLAIKENYCTTSNKNENAGEEPAKTEIPVNVHVLIIAQKTANTGFMQIGFATKKGAMA